ncbi:MAG: aldo/keto reductase [Planctomycetota bacterium]|nr:aldo/keto reductase [Planctomycetota bacterium]
MADHEMTRREFVRNTTIAAAGVAAAAATAQYGQVAQAGQAAGADTKGILNYNPKMEYRACGKTGLMVSGVALGGHWKRINVALNSDNGAKNWLAANIDDPAFQKNRYDIVTKCMEVGINWIDACTTHEVKAYSRAIKGRRDKMYLACSWYENEMRSGNRRTEKALLETLENGMKDCGLDYVDLWRITMHEQSDKHTEAEVEEMMKALRAAKKSGKVRFTGFSSHKREHIKWMIETYPDVVDAFCTPYTAKTKELPTDSVFETVRKYKVGVFGIKPFGGNSLFDQKAVWGGPENKENDEKARLAIRHIMSNPALTAPIPGMVTAQQVENVAAAVAERRKLDVAEAQKLERAMDEAWARLPADHQWLKDFDYV